jgi:hypothetical protein
VPDVSAQVMSRSAFVEVNHDLWHVEESFRKAKTDLKRGPCAITSVRAIQAHPTVCFAALAITRNLTYASGASIKRLVRTRRLLHRAVGAVGGHAITAETH